MITFTRQSDKKEEVFNQFDHKYKFLYKDKALWSILDAFDSKAKHVYRTKILEGDSILMNVNDSLKEKLMDGYIYGYDNSNNQIIKMKSRKIDDSIFVNMDEWLESVELVFSCEGRYLFTDNFYSNVVQRDELMRSTYVFTDQLYRINHYKDVIEAIQLTRFKSIVPVLNIQKVRKGKVVKSFAIERNSKLIGDYITLITAEDYSLIDKCDLELTVDIC